ncbi:putative cytochrome P450 monooxygenase [Linderina pennispora]|uniref:Putative cytochrome P450 monooxygenase n=1 Tax=Linderina pennispora TaxID=61395 RepID=A0A1Y1W2D3_9FUNG|nr:putative cytochrome P450 monooxygenase [Linderina pennispora]ORX67689.1 putative cytochrome P450 monooxygenase [Linderina pennispora]
MSIISAISNFLEAYDVTYRQVLVGGLVIYGTTLALYRLYFSPVSHIPGGLLSRLSMLYVRIMVTLGKLPDLCEDDYYNYGDIFLSAPDIVTISNPDDCRAVMGTYDFIKDKFYESFRLVDETIFTTIDAEFNMLGRRLIGPAFTPASLQKMEPTIMECGLLAIKRKWDKLIGENGREANVNFNTDFTLATFDIISTLVYGKKFRALEKGERTIVKWVEKYNWLAHIKAVIPSVAEFPLNLLCRPLLKNCKEFVGFTSTTVEQRREQIRQGEKVPYDLLQALIDGEELEARAKLTPSQVTAQSIELLGAAIYTTADTITWTLHYLMLYPECYRKAVDEVRSIFAPDHLIGYSEGRSRLPYIEACIYESLRICAVSGFLLPRVVPPGGATFQGYFIPAGMTIALNIAGMNHHRSLWRDSKRFMPERFIERPDLKHQVMSFSTGVRICPGRALAWVKIMTILSNLLKDYDFSLPADAQYSPDRTDTNGLPVAMPRTHSVTVGPKHPERDCILVVTKRLL